MITYPNKDFGIEFKKKFIKRKNIEIKVIGFRTRIVKKQIEHWGKSIIEAEEVKEKKERRNITLSMIFCLKLMSMHFLAVSHGYIMSYKFADDFILINYEYLLLDHASYPGKIIKKDCI